MQLELCKMKRYLKCPFLENRQSCRPSALRDSPILVIQRSITARSLYFPLYLVLIFGLLQHHLLIFMCSQDAGRSEFGDIFCYLYRSRIFMFPLVLETFYRYSQSSL